MTKLILILYVKIFSVDFVRNIFDQNCIKLLRERIEHFVTNISNCKNYHDYNKIKSATILSNVSCNQEGRTVSSG